MQASSLFNGERAAVAGAGAVILMVGSLLKENRFKYVPTSMDTDAQTMIGGIMYVVGWLIVGLSIVYVHSLSPRGITEPLNVRTLLAVAGVSAIALGTLMLEQKRFEKGAAIVAANGSAANISNNNDDETMEMLVAGAGWVALIYVLVMDSDMALFSGAKVALAVVGILLLLAGMKWSEAYKDFMPISTDDNNSSTSVPETSLQTTDGVKVASDNAPTMWSSLAITLGWLFIVSSIAYHN